MTPAPRPVFINGRFLSQGLSGVQRYALEVTAALDDLLASEPALARHRWTVLAPPGAEPSGRWRHLGFATAGRGSGHLWEQTALPVAAAGGVLVNLGNSGPLAHRRSLVVIHDVSVFRTPENYAPRYAAAHRLLGRALARTATVGTVSEFSRREIADVLHLPAGRVFVAPNGHEHMLAARRDETVLDRLGLRDAPFFVFVGTPARNKNLGLALEAFRRLGRPARLVLVGSLDRGVFSGSADLTTPGVVLAGRATDAEIAALYGAAAALVFPSRYEGFGIPPLEAMVNDCPVVAADIPVIREVCGEAALFSGPDDADGFAANMRLVLDQPDLRARLVAQGRVRVAIYTWRRSAAALAEAALAAA